MSGGTLKFAIDDTFKSIVEHAAATDPGPYYGEKIERSVFLVKDEGVYLMSAGMPRQMREDGKRCVVVYAEGLNPEVADRGEVWDEARRICGGDDFGEPLSPKFFEDAIARGAKTLTIKMSENQIAMEAE